MFTASNFDCTIVPIWSSVTPYLDHVVDVVRVWPLRLDEEEVLIMPLAVLLALVFVDVLQ